MSELEKIINEIEFNDRGLVPAVVQHAATGEVLMVAYMNREALQKTLTTGKACFWSRSREELWLKGATSGNYQLVEEIRTDCDNDTILLQVTPRGPACHTGHNSCFYRVLKQKGEIDYDFLYGLEQIIKGRKQNPPPGSYTAQLFAGGWGKMARKIGEEATEVIIAAAEAGNTENKGKENLIGEAADLLYHLLVLLTYRNVELSAVVGELENRHK